MEQPTLINTALQPALLGLDVEPRPPAPAPAAMPSVGRAPRVDAGAERRPRHRYWSVRDLSRRIWFGRGYELLRELIRGGVLPATRSSRNWWLDDADVQGLLAAFEPQAGKVRAFHRLDAWLRERCWVTPLTPEVDEALRRARSGFTWRGRAYLPKSAWTAETAADGEVTYYHRTGAAAGPATASATATSAA